MFQDIGGVSAVAIRPHALRLLRVGVALLRVGVALRRVGVALLRVEVLSPSDHVHTVKRLLSPERTRWHQPEGSR